MSRHVDNLFIAYAIGFVFFVAWIVSMVVVQWDAGARCLEAGYPNSQTTITYKSYCVKRLDQTDVVIPISDIFKKEK